MKLSLPEARMLLRILRKGEVPDWTPEPKEVERMSRLLRKTQREVRMLAERERLAEEQGKAREELVGVLHRLWLEAGEPSTRQMSRDLGMSHMTWHTALRCQPVPPWPTLSALVNYLDGDPEVLMPVWQKAKGKAMVS